MAGVLPESCRRLGKRPGRLGSGEITEILPLAPAVGSGTPSPRSGRAATHGSGAPGRPRQDEAHSMGLARRSSLGLGAVMLPGTHQTSHLDVPQPQAPSFARLRSLFGPRCGLLVANFSTSHSSSGTTDHPRTRRRSPEPPRNRSNYNSRHAPGARRRLLPQAATGLHFPV